MNAKSFFLSNTSGNQIDLQKCQHSASPQPNTSSEHVQDHPDGSSYLQMQDHTFNDIRSKYSH